MKKLNHYISGGIYWGVNIIALVFLVIIWCFGCLHWDFKGTAESIGTNAGVFAVSISGICCVIILGSLLQKVILRRKKRIRKLLYIGWMAAVFGLQLYIAIRYCVLLGWDNTDTLVSAIGIVSGQEEWFQLTYFEMNLQQRCFLITTTFLVWLFTHLGVAVSQMPVVLCIISCICVDASVYVVFSAIKELRGEEAAEKSLFWLLLNPGLISWGIYYYTTNIAMLITAITVCGIIKMWKRGMKPWACFGLGMLAAFGYEYRATMVIVFVAMLIMVFFRHYKACLKSFLVWLAGGALMYLLLMALYDFFLPAMDKENRFPPAHWIMMGAQGVGELNEEDVYYTSSFPTYEEKKEADWLRLQTRIEEMGVSGCLRLAGRKMTYTWSYGNHGYVPQVQYYDSFYDIIWGERNFIFTFVQQMYYMTVLVFMILGIGKSLLHRKTYASDKMLFPLLIFTGGVMFYILWEADPYYSVAFWGIMQMCAADGICRMQSTVSEKKTWKTCMLGGVCLLLAAAGMKAADVKAVQGMRPVMTQTKVNDTLYFDGDSVIEQTFMANKSFDTINLWLTKQQRKEDSRAVYELELKGERSGVVFRDRIVCQDILRVSEYTKSFEAVEIDEDERFSLTITTIQDDPDNRLGIPYYNMPVEVYKYGELKKDGTQLQADLRLQVYMAGGSGV